MPWAVDPSSHALTATLKAPRPRGRLSNPTAGAGALDPFDQSRVPTAAGEQQPPASLLISTRPSDASAWPVKSAVIDTEVRSAPRGCRSPPRDHHRWGLPVLHLRDGPSNSRKSAITRPVLRRNTRPWSSKMTRSQNSSTWRMSWVTRTMVRPCSWKRRITSRHLRWNASSPCGDLVDQQDVPARRHTANPPDERAAGRTSSGVDETADPLELDDLIETLACHPPRDAQDLGV